MKQNIKVGYLCFQNPENKRIWSGTHYTLMMAIKNVGFEVVNLSPIELPRSYHRLLTVYNKIHRIFSKKQINEEYTFLLAYFSSRHFHKVIAANKIDVLFCPAATAAIPFLKTRIPIIFFNDTTYDQLKNYYSNEPKFSKFSDFESSLVQKLALKKADRVLFSSTWAKNFAVRFYNLRITKVDTAILGSNLPIPPIIIKKDFTEEIVFLFVGVVWERKGGQIVLSTLEHLSNKGYNVKMIVVGAKPPVESPLIKYVGFLDKNLPEDEKKLSEYFRTSHFLFVPSRAECYGIVFSEASAFGLLVISTDTGGISSIIKNKKNGFLLPISADFVDYSHLIENLLTNPVELQKLSLECREIYDQKLDWRNFGATFTTCCHDI
ncbi:glycosyltransferase family 4 protein [Kaistella jeonii]|uniref:Glycosyl transferase family 1 domain-containing protein n=1 Tax=Kaistella jeonii TaxID=266749 RepID=A0A0C1FKQ8_9FLAO|nr:glycosyltransferase family 4 protein [Kaistella jeonii]KIA88524.1 hypothetical protein OA86_10885 [Kaistella jeonii]SFC19955.1 Glycosyltransferase involved in cell wall bisynthesis [Kaistella jeonii]VEI97009.1 D-inositol-3-phosphate glycosyltransferase [Kaistella jeonii]